MPEGVEHMATLADVRRQREVRTAWMPEGVEHRVWQGHGITRWSCKNRLDADRR